MANGNEDFETRFAEWRERYPETSDYYPTSDIDFLDLLLARGEISENMHKILLARLEIPEVPELTAKVYWQEFVGAVGDVTADKTSRYFPLAFREVLVSLTRWLIDKMKELIEIIVNAVKPILESAWKTANAALQEVGRNVFQYSLRMFEGHIPVRPEDASDLATELYKYAMGAGIVAHGIAIGTELLHPLKQVGLHQTAALVGDFAGFGRISGAIMGPLMSKVLGQAMTYNVQGRFRPKIADEFTLQMMAVKPDITMDEFRKSMAYHGYSDFWIDKIQRTMYHEPRYFELKMMSEDEAATDEWLRKKSRRAGFTEEDTDVMVRSYIKQASRTQRQDFYKNTFYMYKEGYISKEGFERMLDDLELRPMAKTYGARGADLAYLIDMTKDMISYYVDSFLKDIIDDDELLVSLLSLGIVSQRAWLITAKAKIRKRPRPRVPVTKTAEKAASELQKKYVTLYITQFRKDLITSTKLFESLVAIGLERDLAEVTVSLEAAKKGVLLPA